MTPGRCQPSTRVCVSGFKWPLVFITAYAITGQAFIFKFDKSKESGSQCSSEITAGTQLLKFLLVIVNGAGLAPEYFLCKTIWAEWRKSQEFTLYIISKFKRGIPLYSGWGESTLGSSRSWQAACLCLIKFSSWINLADEGNRTENGQWHLTLKKLGVIWRVSLI